MAPDSSSPVDEAYIRQLIDEAYEDIRRGDVADWDLEEILLEGRRLLAERARNKKLHDEQRSK